MMQGLVFLGDRRVELMKFPDPAPGAGEVVLEMKASGMCGSDLHFYRASAGGSAGTGIAGSSDPVVAGHEPCGVVVEIGSDVDRSRVRVGDRVMVFHYVGCRACEHCHAGWDQLCKQRVPTIFGINAHGGHGTHMKAPAHTLISLPLELSFAAGAAISCGTGTAYAALLRLQLAGNHTIAIFGQGPVGLSATQLAVAMGARVIAVDTSADRLARATQFGATLAINPRIVEPADAILQLTHGRGADVALDTSGAEQARLAALACTKTWGTVAFVGEGGMLGIEVSPMMIRKQLTVLGSWTFSMSGQMDCTRFIADRGIDIDRLFTQRWTIGQGAEAYALFDKQTEGKAVFVS